MRLTVGTCNAHSVQVVIQAVFAKVFAVILAVIAVTSLYHLFSPLLGPAYTEDFRFSGGVKPFDFEPDCIRFSGLPLRLLHMNSILS